jgi:hypothetical protein
MRAHPLGWPRALHPAQSPCRHDTSLGRRMHRCSAAHASLVDGYRAWREAAHETAEAATLGYATELADYWREHPAPTFREYLLSQSWGQDCQTGGV